MLKTALRDIANWRIKRQNSFSKSPSPCLDDYHFKKEEIESVGDLSKVWSQIFLKCLYLARIGRPDLLWSVNKLARSVTKWTGACDKRSARLISCIHHTSDYRQHCHVGNTAQHCRLGSDFAGDFENSNQFREESYVPVGCVRNKRQYPTTPPNQKLFLWMLDCEWMDYMLLIYGVW